MKKYSLILLLFIVVMAGCADQFDQRPSASLPSTDATPNMATFETAIVGVYSTLVNRWSFLGDQSLYADAKGGDVKIINLSSNHFQPVVYFSTDRNSGLSIGAYERFSYLTARVNM
jgi:hypothetical protein